MITSLSLHIIPRLLPGYSTTRLLLAPLLTNRPLLCVVSRLLLCPLDPAQAVAGSPDIHAVAGAVIYKQTAAVCDYI